VKGLAVDPSVSPSTLQPGTSGIDPALYAAWFTDGKGSAFEIRIDSPPAITSVGATLFVDAYTGHGAGGTTGSESGAFPTNQTIAFGGTSDPDTGQYHIALTPPAGYIIDCGVVAVSPCPNRLDIPVTSDGHTSFVVHVRDVTPPMLTLPANIVTDQMILEGAPVTFAASAYDQVEGLRPVSCLPASGSTFPVGTTTVVCSASDSAGNAAGGSFTVTVAASACTITPVTIANTSWNSFNIPAGTNPVVWLNAHIGKPNGISPTTKATVRFTNGSLSVNGTTYPLPAGVMIFDPAAPATISTTFHAGANQWETLVNPGNLSDEIFFAGAAIPATAAIAAGGKATWSFTVLSDAPGLSFPWQWSAAVYTSWPNDWNQAFIQPYHAGSHAGTPLNTIVQKSLIGGPRGGGGSNYTGSWSATGAAACGGN
jgi:hypothetical protein